MGHITIINKDLKIAKKIANEVKETVIITSKNESSSNYNG
ncbi:MAG: hypothetical protein CM15mP102_07960 [Flavobacteriales bacterium]|nr:MAG: hypothetical protein CM15mP102_07960 [Flavobacteriales bacterium]